MNAKVSIVKCKDYQPDLVFAAVKKAIDLIGGISSFIKPQSKVLVKPNLLLAKGPEFGIDAHPEVVRVVIKVLKEINCKLLLGDGSNVWGNQIEDVNDVYEQSGMKRIAEEEGVELVEFNKRRWRGQFPLTSWLDECDYLVSVPKFKTHDFTILTGGVKNLFGLVPGTYKIELHKRYASPEEFARILVDIYAQARPALTVIDGIVAMEGDGPATGGRLRNTGLVFAGVDCVALDSILALIMGLLPQDILTTKEAAKRGLGVSDINAIQVYGEELGQVMGAPFKLPATSIKRNIPRPIVEIAKKLIRFYPKIDYHNCIFCQACVAACPTKAISVKSGRVVIDYKKCISCFCCQEACPASAIKVRKSVMAKLIGL
ncbi:MAG: DUF362 domain-containing protein [Candidatus Omnitrophica bacterium]|nr:DUF362 domain-containing protein [Candidatus Omnitrophota bacterium]